MIISKIGVEDINKVKVIPIGHKVEEIKQWYGGYLFGKTEAEKLYKVSKVV